MLVNFCCCCADSPVDCSSVAARAVCRCLGASTCSNTDNSNVVSAPPRRPLRGSPPCKIPRSSVPRSRHRHKPVHDTQINVTSLQHTLFLQYNSPITFFYLHISFVTNFSISYFSQDFCETYFNKTRHNLGKMRLYRIAAPMLYHFMQHLYRSHIQRIRLRGDYSRD